MIWHYSSIPCYRDYSAVWMLGKSSPISCPHLCPCLCPYPCPCPYGVCVHVRAHVLVCACSFFFPFFIWCYKYYVWHRNDPLDYQGAYEVARKFKGTLTWEWTVKISCKSWRLSFRERSIDWYHFQPKKYRWTVLLMDTIFLFQENQFQHWTMTKLALLNQCNTQSIPFVLVR